MHLTPNSNNLKTWKRSYLKKNLLVRVVVDYAHMRFSNFAIEYVSSQNEKVRQFIRSQGQIFSENKWSKISWHCTFKWANPMTLHLYEPIPWLCMNEFLWLKARGFGEKQRFWSSCTSNRLTLIYLSPECIYDTQFQNLKNVLKHLWKHNCFINLKSCIIAYV